MMIDNDVLTFLSGHLGKNLEDAYQKCSDFAYRDMCRTIDFDAALKETPDNKGLHKIIQKKKTELKNKVSAEIKQMVTELAAKSSAAPKDFDKLFYDTCDRIIEIYRDTTVQTGNTLYFGQAQKWVNMTLKNLYVYTESHPGCGLDLNPLLPYMHIPIDNIVLDIVCGKKPKRCWVDPKPVIYDIDRPATAWSTWDRENYKEFRKVLNKKIGDNFPGIAPIRWELQHWSTVER